MLSGRQKESAINQGITIVDGKDGIAENAGYFVHFVTGQIRQNEDTRLVIANTALVLHFDMVRIDLLLWKYVEGTVVQPSLKNAAARIMPEKGFKEKRLCIVSINPKFACCKCMALNVVKGRDAWMEENIESVRRRVS